MELDGCRSRSLIKVPVGQNRVSRCCVVEIMPWPLNRGFRSHQILFRGRRRVYPGQIASHAQNTEPNISNCPSKHNIYAVSCDV